nr:MAG TPA: hypothetical protein [Caudoviricetes sp.]
MLKLYYEIIVKGRHTLPFLVDWRWYFEKSRTYS